MAARDVSSRLDISAITNTRVLLVSFTAPTADAAAAGAQAAAEELLRELHIRESQQRALRLTSLESRATDLLAEIARAKQHQGSAEESVLTSALARQVASLEGRLQNVTQESLAVRYEASDPGSLVRDPVIHRSHDMFVTSIASGLLIGVLVGLVLAWGLDVRLAKVRRRNIESIAGLPVLASVQWPAAAAPAALGDARFALANYPQLTDVVAPGQDDESRRVADLLRPGPAGDRPKIAHPPASAIVVSRRSHATDLLHVVGRLRTAGVEMLGVVFVETDRRRFRRQRGSG